MKQVDPSDLSVYFRLAGLYRKMNDPEAALSTLKAVEATEGENPRAWEAIRDIHISRGEMVSAYAEQKKLMRHRGKDAIPADQALFTALRYEKALARLAQGKADDAERRLRDIVKEEPSFCPAHIALSEQHAGARPRRGHGDPAPGLPRRRGTRSSSSSWKTSASRRSAPSR